MNEWLIWYMCGSIVYIIYYVLHKKERITIFDNKLINHISLITVCYLLGIALIIFLSLINIIYLINIDYENYKMKFDEEELKRYRIEDVKRILRIATNFMDNGKYNEAYKEIQKSEKLLKDTL